MRLDLVGQKFHRLTVTCFSGLDKGNNSLWQCLCECGNIVVVGGNRLRHKTAPTKSCGCLKIERIKQSNTTHGMSRTPTYKSWRSMIDRCSNLKTSGYEDYGGRGIIVCEQWRSSFEVFLEDMGVRPEDSSIERLDPDGNYEPDNCIWASDIEQNNNLRTNHYLTFQDETLTLAEWARIKGLTYNTISMRLRSNWDIERILTTPQTERRTKDSEYCKRGHLLVGDNIYMRQREPGKFLVECRECIRIRARTISLVGA